MRVMFIILALIFAPIAAAQTPRQNATTEQIETSARKVGRALRCVVCQNQSIDESDAPLAADMRNIVRKRLTAGDNEAQVIAYMRQSYGDYVLLKPPVQKNTFLLWGLPFLVLLGGLFWFFKPPKTHQKETREDKADMS